ncbi:hypothetical protein DIPPA_26330 [Diplonema papillatum]|nr:hypothetical protein DIPPA_26330 [Diplonema papillatum]
MERKEEQDGCYVAMAQIEEVKRFVAQASGDATPTCIGYHRKQPPTMRARC